MTSRTRRRGQSGRNGALALLGAALLLFLVVGCSRAASAQPGPADAGTAEVATPTPVPLHAANLPLTKTPRASPTPSGDPLVGELAALIPPDAHLVALPDAAGKLYLAGDLEGAGRSDLVAVYQVGSGHPSYRVLVASRTADGHLRALWRWETSGGYPMANDWNQLALVDFIGAGHPQLFAAFKFGAAWSSLRVVSFDGGLAKVLLANAGDQPKILTPPGGGLPGLVFWVHLTGPAGLEEAWQWDRQLGRFVRADRSFPDYYRASVVPRLASAQSLAPTSPYAIYPLALAYLQAGEDDQALSTAQQGLAAIPAWQKLCPTCEATGFALSYDEVIATVYRYRGKCDQAIPLYRRIVDASTPVEPGFDWGVLPRAYYGLAACAQQAGQSGQARQYAERALVVGKAPPSRDVVPADETWYGLAQTERILGR